MLIVFTIEFEHVFESFLITTLKCYTLHFANASISLWYISADLVIG